MRKFISSIASIALLFGTAFAVMPVGAEGVTVTLTPSSSSTSPQSVTLSWTKAAGTTYATGTTITISVAAGLDSGLTPLTDYYVTGSSDFNLDGVTGPIDGPGGTDTQYTASSTGSTFDITFTVATTTDNTATTYSVPLGFTFNGTTSTNYSFSVFTSNPADFGAALFYANGGNQVNVTANVPATLSFVIRNAADTSNTNSCDLGTLSLSSVSTCQYRLRIATNAANGFQAQILADHDLGSGSATMTDITNDTAFSSGSESYGIQTLTGATQGGRSTTDTSAFDQPVVEDSPVGYTFDVDSSPVPTSTAQNFISYGGAFTAGAAPSTTATTLVEHAAAMSASTPAGNYQQTVTYTVTASF